MKTFLFRHKVIEHRYKAYTYHEGNATSVFLQFEDGKEAHVETNTLCFANDTDFADYMQYKAAHWNSISLNEWNEAVGASFQLVQAALSEIFTNAKEGKL